MYVVVYTAVCRAGTGEPVEAPKTYTGTAMAYAGKAIDLTTHVLDTAKCVTQCGPVVNIALSMSWLCIMSMWQSHLS